ncbi:membrane-targeted effector domain-containing toxin [Pseudomonas sp. R1-18]|uniref:dermonecrotic toxin domain-containing protein n=1 Tax=Pseudomonas sp. R1-18 TaxID=1632772 RepID=UPI003DA98CDC
MQTIFPASRLLDDTSSAASAALDRLRALNVSLQAELQALPVPDEVLSAVAASDSVLVEQRTSALLRQLDAYWDAPSASGETRYEKLLSAMPSALRDELTIKIHERDLSPAHEACLPSLHRRVDGPQMVPTTHYALHVQLADDEPVEVAGALVMVHEQGQILLVLPGIGATGFSSLADLRKTLVQWLNDPDLKGAVLDNIEQRHQDLLAELDSDPDQHVEPFSAADLILAPIIDSPYMHAIDRLLARQRADVRYICALPLDGKPRHKRLADAIGMPVLLGPGPMLERRELADLEKQYRRSLPDWLRFAAQEDQEAYAERLQQYDHARTVTARTLNAAASVEQFARAQLSLRLANDLGYDLDPDTITTITRRTLPVTGEPYTVSRTLTELALYGLHPGDRTAGSEFLETTTLMHGQSPLQSDYSSLTPSWLASAIEELDLRVTFGTSQQAQYRKEHNLQLMHFLSGRQINALAHAAKLQGHISAEDLATVETAMSQADTSALSLLAQRVRLHRHEMSKLLIIRRESQTGQLQRLIMIAMDAPSSRCFWGFDNEIQLLNELVGWSKSDELCKYLLEQVEVDSRPALASQLAALKLKPSPAKDFLELVGLSDIDHGLMDLAERHASVALSEQERHTPQWFRNASLEQRQELLALEDAVNGARRNYEAKLHTYIQPFKDYVHDRASIQISKLLGVPVGSVDPDLIIVTTERETVTYTDLLLNGYDDSLGMVRSTADRQATFSGPAGVDLRVLSAEKVAASVRGKWLGDDYCELVSTTLLDSDSTGYEYRRKTSLLMTQLQMKGAALRSLLKGHIDEARYQWLRDSINHAHLSDTRTRQQYPLYPLQIHVDKPFIASRLEGVDQLVIADTHLTHVETVQGCIAVLPMSIRQAAVLYTPEAPDGVEFRPFSAFTESLNTPGMADYYKDRCRVASRQTLSFFLRDMQQGNGAKAPFLPKEPISDFADTCFNRPVLRKLRDVKESTKGRSDMLSALVWNSVEVIVTVATLPFPPASFAVGVLLSLHDSVRALQSLRDGDSEAACAYILTSILNSLGAAGDLHSGLKGFGSVARQIAPPSSPAARPVQRALSLPSYDDLYPKTFRDKSSIAAKPGAKSYLAGMNKPGAAKQPVIAPSGTASTSPFGARAVFEVDLSLENVSRLTEGHARGTCIVDGKYYIELSGKTFEVQYDAQIRHWQVIDPQNPFAFFGKQPVRLDEQGAWQVADRPGLLGGGLDSPPSYRPLAEEEAAARSTTQSDYELPESLRKHMKTIITGEVYDPVGIEPEYFESIFTEIRQTFTALRENLYRDADTFFDAPVLPPRPPLPTLAPGETVDTLVERLFAGSNGLVLSEAPKSVASKRLLIQNMPLLAKERVEILYIEHLFTDKHLPKLAKYRQLGKKTRSGSHEIKDHLEHINDKVLDNKTTEYDYYHLIKAAHRHGIEVRPFSSSISYPHAGHPVATAADDAAAGQKMSLFFGHKVISGDVLADSTRRWVALLDEKLAITQGRLPGIAELEGVPSVQVQDVATGSPTRIKAAAPGTAATDFTVEFANPLIIAPPTALPPSAPVDLALLKAMGKPQGTEAGERWAGEYGFRWDQADGWHRIEPEQWLPASPPTSIQQSLADAQYEVPVAYRKTLHELAHFERRGLDQHYFITNPEHNAVQEIFFAVRSRLQKDARNIVIAELPPRPTMPDVEPQIPQADFLERLYQHTDGVVIGETHSSVASKQLIIDNLPALSQQNVKTLYLEHLLTDLNQADLDRFFETGQMSKTLLHDLKKLDRGHRTDPSGVYTFERLVIRAQQHGIEIRSIDCAASYHLKGIPGEAPTTREQMMNYFASLTIRKHQEVMGSHKWIALVGNSHSNTYQNLVPGLAELEGGIGLRVMEVPPGEYRITRDLGETVRIPLTSESVRIKADYLVEMEVPGAVRTTRQPLQLPASLRLSHPGMFVIEEAEDGMRSVVHRSRDTSIQRTPVLTNADGKLYVERPSWKGVHLTPYNDIDSLIDALERINLTFVA